MGDLGVVIGVFTDQAYNLILLAEDEARILGQAVVGPEHLLLALARRGNVASLLGQLEITATDIHGAIVRADGIGDRLVLGRVPRSAEADAALERAIRHAAERGVRGPSSEHVLLGLIDDAGVRAILSGVGIDEPEALVNETYPPGRRPPLNTAEVMRYAERARYFEPPQPGPMPPVFERFTTQARAAVMAAICFPGEGGYIESVDLLLGLLSIPDGIAATVLASHGVTLQRARERVEERRPGPQRRPPRHPTAEPRRAQVRMEPELPQLISDTARRLVAEGALRQAYENGHGAMGTGHLLLAVLEGSNGATSDVLGKDGVAVAASVLQALPGDETVFGPLRGGRGRSA